MKIKASTRKVLSEIKYPVRYKRFSKIFKRIKKSERRFFIKLLKVICKDIKNKELIEFATYSHINLNQHGLFIMLQDRIVMVHSKVKSKRIYYEVITYDHFVDVDFEPDTEEDFGDLFFKYKRKKLSEKSVTVRMIKSDDLPKIVEFIRIKMSETL
ncbi:PH domain-containing protein [Macrococcoides caseolyticum]|uniref:PH domain-containing protein n=1 Tax=Macrococcoides caseolyticum TaxID=69966 RepID=UPI001F2C4A5A|nr:PH domain-containing protein [Macrococcus caseolyticus]MCE4957730.1 PH domain-containing protein [Macrococcus caseolyticus]